MSRSHLLPAVRRTVSPVLQFLLMATAGAQTGRPPAGLGRSGTDTERYSASTAAATRGIALCSGLPSRPGK